MFETIKRHGALVIGVFLAGFFFSMSTPALASPRGAAGPTMLQADAPALAGISIIVAIAVTSVIAGIVGRLINAAVGWFVLGAGLFVLAFRLDGIEELALGSADISTSKVYFLLFIETMLLAAAALGGVWIIYKLAGPLQDIEPNEHGRIPHPLRSSEAMRAALAGAIVLPTVWLVAQSPLRGQSVAAVFHGAMFAGLIGRLLSPHVQPVWLCVSPIIFGAVGYLYALFAISGSLDTAFVISAIPAVGIPTPIDYVAGTLMGAPAGIGWARSFLHHEDHPHPHVAPTS